MGLRGVWCLVPAWLEALPPRGGLTQTLAVSKSAERVPLTAPGLRSHHRSARSSHGGVARCGVGWTPQHPSLLSGNHLEEGPHCPQPHLAWGVREGPGPAPWRCPAKPPRTKPHAFPGKQAPAWVSRLVPGAAPELRKGVGGRLFDVRGTAQNSATTEVPHPAQPAATLRPGCPVPFHPSRSAATSSFINPISVAVLDSMLMRQGPRPSKAACLKHLTLINTFQKTLLYLQNEVCD